MADIHGTCDPRFGAVKDALSANLDAGNDVGASVAVVIEGAPVVDIWGGFADEARTRPWEADTITNVWSTTKTMTALSALLLVDRGELDLNAPVAKYWPEFKAGGKEGVEVRHLLGHTAGLSGWTEPVTMEDTADWEKMTSLLAAQEPWWEPGTQSGYHALSQGYLVGEVVRRISGQTLGRFFKAELAEPLGADFHIGLGPEHDHRVANVIPPPPIDAAGLDPASIAVRTLTNPMLAAEASWNRWWKAAEIPAANGHGNARSVARVQSVLSCRGTVDGRTYLSEETCDKVFEQQASGTDLVLGVPMVLGVGYGINSAEMPLGPNPRTCFWGGWGGSLIVNDLDAQTTVAYMMNKMQSGLVGDERGIGIVFAALTAAGAA